MEKKVSRARKTSYNIIILGIYEIVAFLCNLVLPRLIIGTYGSEYNGIVSSVSQFLNIVALLRLGVAGATRVELYKSLATDDIKQTSAIVKATELYLRKVSMAIVAYIAVMAVVYPLFVKTAYSGIEVGLLIVAVGIGTFSQYFFGLTYQTLLQADQKLYIYYIIQIFANFGNTLISCLLIYKGMSIQTVKYVSALIFTISPIVLRFYVSRHYNIDKTVKPDNTALNKRSDVLATSIANIIHENTDVVVLTVFSTVKVVSVYTVYNLVVYGLRQLMQIFVSSLESPFGDICVKKEKKNLEIGLINYEFFIFSFVSIVFACAMFLIIPFISIYTKNVTDINYILPGYAFFAFFALAFYCYRMPYMTIVQAAGFYKETRNGAFVEAALNILISIFLTLKIGIIGVAIGTLAANVFRTIQYAYFLSKNMIERSVFIPIKGIIWSISNCVFAVLICYGIQSLFGFHIDNWIKWCAAGMLSMIIALSVWLISSYICYRQDLMRVLGIITRRVKRNNG